ncbi:MAG: hypothetical protein A2231_03115 [Candidatus Firestonebacteria bacterium RIFOXYA2_FULL_40_8]|nr:MAG: hypothetical protein A2231_03115 [Candidatus Firestonebacteria bacterium RIFOXYA2_FULL_40_8]
MNFIKKLFRKNTNISDDEFEDKIRVRVAELFIDLKQKGIITINEPFTWRAEYCGKTGRLRIFHREAMSAVDNMLDEIGVTNMEHESKNN